MNSCDDRFTVTVKLVIGDGKDVEFTDDKVINAPAYSLPLLTGNVLFALPRSLLNSLVSNNVTSKTAANTIILVHHIRSTISDDLLMRRNNIWVPSDTPDLKFTIEMNKKLHSFSHASNEVGVAACLTM